MSLDDSFGKRCGCLGQCGSERTGEIERKPGSAKGALGVSSHEFKGSVIVYFSPPHLSA